MKVIIETIGWIGGVDAEDFTRMLYEMYRKYCESKNWQVLITDESPNSIGGYRSISIEILGKNVYGIANAIRSLLTEPKLRQRLGMSAYQRVMDEFTWQKQIQKTRKLFLELI
jgi:glycosyltransferase involved in cell wall biosynthesis